MHSASVSIFSLLPWLPLRPSPLDASRRRSRALLVRLTLLCALAPSGTAAAQATLTGDAAVVSGYVWRGVTFANSPVAQADLVLAAPLARGTLTLAGWANAELGTHHGTRDISMLPAPHRGSALTSTALWLEYARDAHPGVSLAGGAMGYRYPAKTGFAEGYNTAELYARLSLAGPLAPKLTVYQDVRRIRGSYAEASAAHAVGPAAHPVTLGLLAGVNVGQEPAAGQSAYFARRGLTHVDLSATTAWTHGGLAIAPALHVQHSVDEAARVLTRERLADWKLWGGLTLTYARRLARGR